MKANREVPTPQSWRFRLSSLGLGVASIGHPYEPGAETVAIDTIAATVEAGISYVDTAHGDVTSVRHGFAAAAPFAPVLATRRVQCGD
jgi:hypothetical protein